MAKIVETDTGGAYGGTEPSPNQYLAPPGKSFVSGLRTMLVALVRLLLALAMCLFVVYLLIDLVMQLPVALGLVQVEHDMSSGAGHYL